MKSYLGIDPGWSAKSKSTGLCRIEISDGAYKVQFDRVGTDPLSRVDALSKIISDGVTGVGIDGPIIKAFGQTDRLRPAESLLSRGKFQYRGKPASTNSGSGPELHAQATWWAVNAESFTVGSAPNWAPTKKLVIESFPSAFLSVMHPDTNFPRNGRPWSTTLLTRAPVRIALNTLVKDVLGGGDIDWDTIDNCSSHEADAFLSALSAALVDAGDFTAVGDTELGFVVLPPVALFGRDNSGVPWAIPELDANLLTVQSDVRFHDLLPQIVLARD
jgi:hypothetical protein